MALTRPRYSQIPDSDYKNSCRIVTTTNVSLTGGAPLTYDGVTLVQYDRVLVAGQTDKTQNGIYSVSTLGSGSNGTWVRSKDANANDRLTAGMNTFIEEGTYTGQFWHLLTPGPIVLGVTELIFGQISGNAAGISSQVQYNSSGSIAGAANLRYDSATGNVLIGGGTVSTSNVTGALVVNGGIGVTGEIWAQSNIYSVGSRVLTAFDLETVTFLANYISKDPANVAVPVVGTGTIYGTHNFGNLAAISTFGDYNTTNSSGYYSVNDASGAPGFVVYIGFTGITDFNRAVYNINYTQSSGHTVTIDLYNYDTDAWDAFAQYSGSGSWQTFALSVIDADPYIDVTGNVTTRIYHVSSGNTAHRTWIDYVALEKSITGGSGPRGATGPTGPSGTYTGGYIIGNVTIGNTIISNSGNVSISTTTGALILTGDGGAGIGGNIFAGGNITANAFYTVNGLFWEGNGLAFSSGLEVSEINTANALSNISTQVTSLRFDKDTGFTVTELNPGNVKISLGSSFKTWHVPGQSDLVAVAEDEVTFFGNGIDITTNPSAPKSITFIANNSVLEANIGAYQIYANSNAASQQTTINNINANLGAYQIYANANIGTLFLGNLSTQANLGAYQLYANANAASQQTQIDNIVTNANTNTAAYLTTYTGNIAAGNVNITSNLYIQNINVLANIATQSELLDGTITEFTAITENLAANDAAQGSSIDAIAANLNAFQLYANTKIGTNTNSNLVVASNTDSVSAITGALVVNGGVGIGGNLYVAGNIFASNLVSISATTLTVQDPLLYLAASDPYPYNYDIGFYSHYVSDHYQHTGLVRDYTDSVWTFFSNIFSEPGTTIDWTEGNLIYDTVRLGDLIVANSTPSTNEYSGALRVSGGAGIAGALFITNTGDVSANIGTLFLGNTSTNANLGAFQTYANIYLGTAATFTVTESGFNEYIINGETNPALYLIRGQRYNFSVDAVGNPFWIKTVASIGSGNQYNTGVINNGEDAGVVVFDVPLTAPDILYYVSQFDAAMTNQLVIVNFNTLDANIGTLFLGNVSTQANLGTLYLGNISTQANLGAFQTYANTTFTTYSNANVDAYLPVYTGNISAGNIDVTSKVAAEKIYTTDGVYWSGNGVAFINGSTYTADTAPPVSGNVTGDQWYNTVTDVLFEYLDNGVSQYWVDVQTSVIAANAVVTIPELIQANLGAFQAYANTKIGTNTDSNLVVDATTTSTSITTGALVVKGGAGIAGNVIVGGNASITSNLTVTQSGLFRGPYDEYSLLSGVFVGNTGTAPGITPRVGFFNGNTQQNWQIDNNLGEFRWFVPGATKLSLYPNGNLNVTGSVTVGGKKAVNGPAFSAYANSSPQTITSGSQQKVLFQTEEFDTDNCYANSRFTPNVEGYYQLNAEVRLDGASGTGEMMIVLYRNGSEYKRGTNQQGTQIAANFWAMQVSSLAYADGIDDYFEIYVQQGSGSSVTVTAVNAQAITWFNGCMVRGA